MQEGSFLSVRDLHVEYTSDGQVIHAVNGVSFDLEKGNSLGLVGETGAGKTSIAKAILGILPVPPARVTEGSIVLEGEDLLQKSEQEMLSVRGNKISMIFQDPMTALNPVMSVGQQIEEVIRIHNNITNHEAKQRTIDMMKMVGITAERYDDFPHQFSGGMKQRIVIAMALACKPQLLLADEPTTALDVTIQAMVLDIIDELRETLKTSMILITHDLGVVARMCDDVAVVYAGEIIEYGSKKDIFLHPSHPYTVGLFRSLPDMAKGERRLHVIEGQLPDPANLPQGCKFAERCQYATKSCMTATPDLREMTPGHFCRCIRYGAGKE